MGSTLKARGEIPSAGWMLLQLPSAGRAHYCRGIALYEELCNLWISLDVACLKMCGVKEPMTSFTCGVSLNRYPRKKEVTPSINLALLDTAPRMYVCIVC